MAKEKKKANEPSKKKQYSLKRSETPEDCLWSMSHGRLNQTHWFQMIPSIFFTTMIILIVRMYDYKRDMSQFYWSGGNSDLTDFFSYYKMSAILGCAILVLLIILYKIMSQSMTIKRCFAYIPMAVYSFFVLVSYFESEYKEFALWGWNDRFEGTIPLLCYMVLLFYIINSVNSEENVKWMIYLLAISSALLGLLGLSQALDHDFFQTTFGKMLITPSWYWESLNQLDFKFDNKQIYQTVYNINYVSFYLTLLIPLFGMLFLHAMNKGKEEKCYKKVMWGALFTLLIYNMIGSASSGGLLGLGIIGVIGIIVLNKKILEWRKPIAILLLIGILLSGATYSRWIPEFTSAVQGVINTESAEKADDTAKIIDKSNKIEAEPGSVKAKIDYIQTKKRDIILSINSNPLKIHVMMKGDSLGGLELSDKDGKTISLTQKEEYFAINDSRFHDFATITPTYTEGNYYIFINTHEMLWPFAIMEDQIYYRNRIGNFVNLYKVPSVGFSNNPSFGNGRGYIWSRTIPMMKDTLFLGKGADTYCIYHPHNDYAGKYNAGWNVNLIVDKPHNMYMGMAVGTGGLSLFALLSLFGFYLIQSFKLYFRIKYETDFLTYVGAGIFFGICGFLTSALVNDSSVSVMPMFYGLLGTGIAINIMLQKKIKKEKE
ncbi:MAG: O-antigen ligase family protein [Anaerovorax sp.]|nr:O-antigen ligase family protein [Anaerovorax sp.]